MIGRERAGENRWRTRRSSVLDADACFCRGILHNHAQTSGHPTRRSKSPPLLRQRTMPGSISFSPYRGLGLPLQAQPWPRTYPKRSETFFDRYH